MDSKTECCCFIGFKRSRPSKTARRFTCIHGFIWSWHTARRALGIEPLLVYRCSDGHLQYEKNYCGKEIACNKCSKTAVKLTRMQAKEAGAVRFFSKESQ